MHFVAAVVTGAVLVIAHLSLVLTVVRDRKLVIAWKVGALLVPPVAPIAGWKAHHRRSTAVWCLCVAAYALARWIGG